MLMQRHKDADPWHLRWRRALIREQGVPDSTLDDEEDHWPAIIPAIVFISGHRRTHSPDCRVPLHGNVFALDLFFYMHIYIFTSPPARYAVPVSSRTKLPIGPWPSPRSPLHTSYNQTTAFTKTRSGAVLCSIVRTYWLRGPRLCVLIAGLCVLG